MQTQVVCVYNNYILHIENYKSHRRYRNVVVIIRQVSYNTEALNKHVVGFGRNFMFVKNYIFHISLV